MTPKLTNAEQRIVNYIAEGYHKRSDLAELLVVTMECVRTHMQNIYRKFDVHDLTELQILTCGTVPPTKTLKAPTTRYCYKCRHMKTVAEFRAGATNCLRCEVNGKRYAMPTISAILPRNLRFGDLVTWTHRAPTHLPPVALTGRVIGTIDGKPVAQVAGSTFVVEV